MLTKKPCVLLQQPSNNPPRRLQRGIHMDTKHSTPWRQILRHRVAIEPWMPFSHPSKGRISTSNQVEFYQKMNPLACPESLEQLSKTLRRRVAREHNRIHGCQRCLTTINCFSNVLSTILKKHNGMTAPGIRPQTVSSLRCFLESRGSFRNPTRFTNKVQASTWDTKEYQPTATQ
jgi:hypothetical protein